METIIVKYKFNAVLESSVYTLNLLKDSLLIYIDTNSGKIVDFKKKNIKDEHIIPQNINKGLILIYFNKGMKNAIMADIWNKDEIIKYIYCFFKDIFLWLDITNVTNAKARQCLIP